MALRDAIGGAMASPADRMREDELSMVPWLETSPIVGYSPGIDGADPPVIGESLRRVADTASELWRVDVIGAQVGVRHVERRDRRMDRSESSSV